MIDFPTSPTVGQVYSPAIGGISWYWNGNGWQLLPNGGQPSNVVSFIMVMSRDTFAPTSTQRAYV